MQTEALARQRYRTLGVAVLFHIVLALGGAYGAYQLPERGTIEWVVYPFSAAACLLIWWRARAARLAGRQVALERWTTAVVLLGAGLLLQRMAFAMFGGDLQAHGLSVFRPVFAYWPFIYLAAFLLLPSRRAAWLSWSLGALVAVVGMVGLQVQTGLTLREADEFSLVLWLLVGNPLFLLMLGALPRYEDWLRVAGLEMQQLRERSELLERVSASERRFNLVVDSLQVGVWDHRFELGVMVERWWSPRFYALTGYTPEELPPSEESSRRLFGDAVEDLRSALYVQSREARVTTLDTRMHTKDRGWRWVNIACKAELDDEGRFTRITGAIEDIHQRRTAELELHEAQAELTALAYRDALTSMHNRRAFDEQLQREWDRARRSGKSLALMTIDIDWFKRFNDHYGHPAGDECLRQVAQVIGQCLRRPGDFAGRMGGEEFQVMMPETDVAGAMLVAKLMLTTLQERGLPHADSPLKRVTCSIGVAAIVVSPTTTRQSLIDAADAQLYESKRLGRARVSVEAEPA